MGAAPSSSAAAANALSSNSSPPPVRRRESYSTTWLLRVPSLADRSMLKKTQGYPLKRVASRSSDHSTTPSIASLSSCSTDSRKKDRHVSLIRSKSEHSRLRYPPKEPSFPTGNYHDVAVRNRIQSLRDHASHTQPKVQPQKSTGVVDKAGEINHSRAICCPPPSNRDVIIQDENEADCRLREKMYAGATWRMYDRIMKARMKSKGPLHPLQTREDGLVPMSHGDCLLAERCISAANSSEAGRQSAPMSPQHEGIFALDD